MEYVAAGYNMLTDVTFADGTQILNTPGGSWYAASGLVFWRKSVAYVGTAGPDFNEYYGKWFSDNGIDCRVKKCLPQTLKYSLKYRPDGIWTEECSQGEAYERMAKDAGRITPQMMAEACGPETKGIYIEASLSAKIASIRARASSHGQSSIRSYIRLQTAEWAPSPSAHEKLLQRQLPGASAIPALTGLNSM